MRTVIIGCEIELVAENHTASILLGEAILAFLESFLSTAIRLKGHYPARPYMRVNLRQSEYARAPFTHRVEEDECGETRIVIAHPVITPPCLVQDARYRQALFELLAEVITQIQVPFSSESLEGLFANDRARDRAFLTAQSPLCLSNVALSANPKYHARDWVDESLAESLAPLRTEPWKPTTEATAPAVEAENVPFTFAEGAPSTGLFGVDALKHRDIQILSPINMALWDTARWCGLGFAIRPGDPPIPELILLFENFEAGMKIFRGWRKRLGEVDRDEWIGLTLITGIDCHHPAHYRVVLSVNEDYLTRKVKPTERFVLVHRRCDITPMDNANLDRFLYSYKKTGCYRLAPGLLVPNQPRLCAGDLSIDKRQLRIVPAWQIGPNDPARVALGGINDPVIPLDVSDPPILKVLKQSFGPNKQEKS